MLYIEFDIKDSSKYNDFEKLYNHMVKVRQVNFKFEEEEEVEIDWDNVTDEEVNEIFSAQNSEKKRYKELIPNYADQFLKSYVGFDQQQTGLLGFKVLEILNYLEFSFEVDMVLLKKQNENSGIVEFSTGNYPYGGMERFLMTLKAFDLIPTECYNGFTIYKFNWISDFKHKSIELTEKTTEYLKKFKG